jgi:anti-sigma factor RsiW
MTCKELIDFLDDYVDGRLAADERTRFDRHLGVCRDCRSYLASYQATVRLAQNAAAEDVAAGMPKGLIEAIRAARRNA